MWLKVTLPSLRDERPLPKLKRVTNGNSLIVDLAVKKVAEPWKCFKLALASVVLVISGRVAGLRKPPLKINSCLSKYAFWIAISLVPLSVAL